METIQKKIETYLSFRLNNELFAVRVNKVLEVLEKQYVTSIPQAPEFLKGVVNFRGEVLPVIDIRKKFNMEDRNENEKYVIIVLDLDRSHLKLGAIVDGVKDVMELNEGELKEVPKAGFNYRNEFIEGMYNTNDRFMMILDFERLFTDKEKELFEETTTGA